MSITMRSRGVSSYRRNKRNKRGNKLSKRLSKRRVKRSNKHLNKRSNRRLNRKSFKRASKRRRTTRKSYRRGGAPVNNQTVLSNIKARTKMGKDLNKITIEEIDDFAQKKNTRSELLSALRKLQTQREEEDKAPANLDDSVEVGLWENRDLGKKVRIPIPDENYIMVKKDGADPVGIKYLYRVQNAYQDHHVVKYIGEENNGETVNVPASTKTTFHPYNEALLQ